MKKKVLRILAVLLVFSICTSLLPSSVFAVTVEEPVEETTPTMVDFIAGNATAEDIYGVLDASIVPAAIDYNEAVEKNHIARCYEDEGTDLNRIIFLNIDGTKTMYTFDFPVKYVDGNGNIQDIRLEIADSTVNAGAFETAANNTVTTFSAQFTDGIALEGNNTEIRLIPILPAPDLSATLSTTDMAATTATAQRIDANTVAYPYDAKTTVEYSLTYTGFKEDIVVSEYTGQTTYPFRLLTNGLALEEIDGSFFLVDDAGNIEASIGDIIIFTADERNNDFGDIEPKTIIENQEYLLNIVVDAEYLADPATTYPIRIDPTIEIKYSNNGAGAVEDITISTNTNFSGTYTSLYVGRRSTEGIARILMRFPALDVSTLTGAVVTSATVRIRDLMCEDDPLDVSCHVFTGNVWDGNSATWANSSPNSYVSTPLSTNTLKWSIGNTFSSKHWYTFDVTSAVQGWIDGNYNKSKGIIFKVASSIENGSAIKNRTFGSYNRSSYRPSLTVTYTPNTSQTLTNDTYYLNNRGTGKYLQLNTTNNARGVSGLLTSLGNRIQWKIQPVGSGYVIRAASNPNLCLSCGASPGDSSVYALTVSDSSIPSTCMWSIIPASGGDYLIRSMAYGNYLFSSVTSIYTSSSTGSYGSAAYEKYVWRAAKTSEYGNASSYTYKELESGFSVNDIILNIGDGYTPIINNKSSGALWANLQDFSFTLSSGTGGCISVAELNNRITAQKPGIATYTVTHKVTGRSTTFKVYVDRYTYVLTTEFKFNDSDAVLIRSFYDRIESMYIDDFPEPDYQWTAWIASRVLGGIIYNHKDPIQVAFFDSIAGISFAGNNEEEYLTSTLGYSDAECAQLIGAIQGNYSDASNLQDRSDFAHMQMSLSARLAYVQWIATVGEDGSYMGGWLGDAVIWETDEINHTTSLKNDDYHEDLDAENIFRLTSEDCSLVEAANTYYANLTSSSNRAVVFLGYIDYETVRSKIHNYLLIWDDETIKTAYPDTYNFLKSLQAGLPDIYNFAAE